MNKYDVAVIGGGPGGYVAAIRAAQLGKKVVLIEKDDLGGVCLNWGCIPTKALLKSAELYSKLKRAEDFGIFVENPKFDMKKLVQRSRSASAQLTEGVKSLLKKNKVSVKKAIAKLEGNGIITMNAQAMNAQDRRDQITADNIIIATGARPRIIPGFEPNGTNIWTSKEAMTPTALPSTIMIVGSGAIGVEFASFYNALGSKVILVDIQSRILPAEDEEISALAHKIFVKNGIEIHLGIKLLGHSTVNGIMTVECMVNNKRTQFKVEKLLMAVGIVPNTEGLGLEKTSIKFDRGHIITDSLGRTNEEKIYAIGDVAGAPWLAHKASHEGIIAAETIANLKPHGINLLTIPGCTYSSPQIASVGLTEQKAKEKGLTVKVGRFPFFANGKALVIGETEGLIKTIFDAKTGELLGAHLIGAEVTELISNFVLTKNMEGTAVELMNTIFPHPALTEMLSESVLQAYGKAIHI